MNKIHASIKVSREELEATNGYTVGEQYTPFVNKLRKQVEETANGEKFTWYLYDRFPNGPESEVILILQNSMMEQSSRVHLQANMVAVFNSEFELINPKG